MIHEWNVLGSWTLGLKWPPNRSGWTSYICIKPIYSVGFRPLIRSRLLFGHFYGPGKTGFENFLWRTFEELWFSISQSWHPNARAARENLVACSPPPGGCRSEPSGLLSSAPGDPKSGALSPPWRLSRRRPPPRRRGWGSTRPLQPAARTALGAASEWGPTTAASTATRRSAASSSASPPSSPAPTSSAPATRRSLPRYLAYHSLVGFSPSVSLWLVKVACVWGSGRWRTGLCARIRRLSRLYVSSHTNLCCWLVLIFPNFVCSCALIFWYWEKWMKIPNTSVIPLHLLRFHTAPL